MNTISNADTLPELRSPLCGSILFISLLLIISGLCVAPPLHAQPPASVSQSSDETQPQADWELITAAAGWQPRDSSGELVFRDRMWIFGGWFDSWSAPPRDVWSSADGRNWQQVTPAAPWIHSDLPMTVVFRDRMWLMGGWYNGRLEGHSATNQVWSSTDGRHWDAHQTSAPRWSPRLAAGVAVLGDRMWVAGGTENYYFGDESSLRNDVWSSSDGNTWTQESARAEWSPRAYHQLVAHNGRLWVLGGGNYVPEHFALNDVWSSVDGRIWRQETAAAPWPSRLWFSAVSWRGCLWVVGGWSGSPSVNHADVWYSRDGREWKQLRSSIVWKERHEHSVFVFQDKLWVAAGHAQPLSSEVWSLSLPPGFPE